jgi:putative transposase
MFISTRWIGVDLNTTGHVAVAADPKSGKVMKLGKNIHYVHNQSSKNCTKLWKEGKLWKLKKIKNRKRKDFKAALNKISRQIVSFAESLGSGIKFEKLFSQRYSPKKEPGGFYEFSFKNGSFFSLQRQVEKRALDRGIPVMYINPYSTSKRCSRCGCRGRRLKKQFECPHCGYITHADVNAAFNIASSVFRTGVQGIISELEKDYESIDKKQVRRMVKERHPGCESRAQMTTGSISPQNLLEILD